jgi:hypothetical protein
MSTIIIEGPDGAGKTRLVEALLDRYPEYRAAPRACTSIDGPLSGRDLVYWINRFGMLDGNIYDRHPAISGPVYDAVLSRRVELWVQPWIQGIFHEIHESARVIYCRPPRRAIVEAVNGAPQMDGVNRMIHRLVDTYDAIMANMIQHERYDWTRDDLPSL